MAEPRLSSRPTSSQQPESVPGGHRVRVREGYGSGFSTPLAAKEKERREYRERLVQWCENNLPDEIPAFAGVAFGLERARLRREPTAKEVYDRLVVTGRDRAAWDEAHS